MAFTLQVIRGSTTYTISDPYTLEGAEGMGGASVRNIEDSGPYQDGTTHLDERLDPRTITLKLNVTGTSASTLDGYRDTLMKMFKPVKGVAITLKVTRDDGSVRQIDTRRTGPLDIPLVAINRPGNLHRAVVQLRAADPIWYDPTEQEEVFAEPSGDWWLGYATIGSANVLTHVESPTQGQLWDNATGVTAGSPFTIVFKSDYVLGTVPSGIFAYETNSGGNLVRFLSAPSLSGGYQAGAGNTMQVTDVIMTAGTHDYFVVSSGTLLSVYRDTTLVGTDAGTSYAIAGTATGTHRWRRESNNDAASNWTPALPYAAAYNIALDSNQRSSLQGAMQGTALSGSAYTASIPYLGDVDSYPVITIQGPFVSPVITNETTGDTLDFTGGTVGTSDIWVIDTRYGRKSALMGTTSVASYLSTDSDLSTFRLVPDPIATGGTNVVTVSSTGAGTAASVTISYYNRYLSH